MATAGFVVTEDQFLCPICLDVFSDPVATPCGHNFCKNCISKYWAVNALCQCPVCKEIFSQRPELQVNTLISQMVAQFQQTATVSVNKNSSEPRSARSGVICCDVCTENKHKALKSCLDCQASYCETHLEPHLTVQGLKKHQLINPIENMVDRLCPQHDKPLELVCRTDQINLCMLCMVLEHKHHDVVPLKKESEDKKAELERMTADIQQMILKRRLKIEQINRSVELSHKAADKEKADGIQVFTDLRELVGRSQAEFIESIEEKQKEADKHAKGVITKLEQEISELEKKGAEVEQLSYSEDHLRIIRSFPSLNGAFPTKDWTDVSVSPPKYEGTVVRAVAQLKKTLSKELKKIFQAELRRIQQFAVEVTLNRDTANLWLLLSDDGKQVHCGEVQRNLPDGPNRFSPYASVLGEQSFSSGAFYFEVQVLGKTKWGLGVARESINRRGHVKLNPQNGYWTISLTSGNDYKALDEPRARLSLWSKPERVGVFVDYEEGLVSFYDVDTAALIYSFTDCRFNEKLYPFLNPCNSDGGKNSAPLIICSPQKVKVDLTRVYSRRR